MNYKNFKQLKNGQVMLMTLLVLMIVAVAIIGMILLLNRDTLQIVNNAKYEQALNATESHMKDLIDVYGDASVNLSQSAVDPNFNCNIGTSTTEELGFLCSFLQSTKYSEIALNSDIEMVDTKYVEDFELAKDESFTIDLSGYSDTIQFTWTNNFAMEFTAYGLNGSGQYVVVSDLFDKKGVFTESGASDPLNDIENYHDFPFQLGSADIPDNSVRFNIGGINGFAGVTSVKLIVTARAQNSLESTLISIFASDNSSFPYQMREFRGKGYDPEDSTTPVAKIISKFPLTAQIDEIFNYSFIVEDAISL